MFIPKLFVGLFLVLTCIPSAIALEVKRKPSAVIPFIIPGILVACWALARLGVDVEGFVDTIPGAALSVLGGPTWDAALSVLGFIWGAVPYVVVGYIAIEQFRINHNLSILRRGVENLQGKQFTEY